MSQVANALLPTDRDAGSTACNCEKLFRTSQLQFFSVPGHGYLDQLCDKAWTCEIYHDPEHQIGSPPPYLTSPKELFQYSPFVLCIGFLNPCGADETACIDGLMAYTGLKFSALHVPQAVSGVLLTRDATSIHIRMACAPSCCQTCGKCKHCLSQIPAVNTFVERLGTVALNIYIRQRRIFWKATDREKPLYPKTEPAAFTQLLMRLLRGFHKGGFHDRDTATFQQQTTHAEERQHTLIASTYESTPFIGCIYSVETRSITDICSPKSLISALQCAICLGPVGKLALMQMPCHCFRCIDCLEESFRLALSARHNFPPACCGEIIYMQKYAEHLQRDLVSNFFTVADEFTAKNQLYCGNLNCSAFIRTALIANSIGICPRCFAQTCANCGQLESNHSYQPKRACPKTENETRLETFADEQQWKGCPQCRALVERSDGCNHMRCHCGQMFCYQCGAAYTHQPNCDCGLGLNYLQEQESEHESDHEDDLRGVEEESDDDDDDDEDNREEDEEDTQQREMLLAAGLELRRGDLARIRAEEIRLRDAVQERQAQEEREVVVESTKEVSGHDIEHNDNEGAHSSTVNPASGPLASQRAVASRRASNRRRLVGAPPVW